MGRCSIGHCPHSVTSDRVSSWIRPRVADSCRTFWRSSSRVSTRRSSHAVWRIAVDAPDYGSDDLSGKGAEKTGGRWNRKGTPVIYASGSIALSFLETLVHLAGPQPLPLNRYLVKIDIPAAVWKARKKVGRRHM